jgi:hypothetical protein
MLENGHSSMRVADVQGILSALQVGQQLWGELSVMAAEGTAPGWWSSWGAAMGERQTLYVDLETGAKSVREYQMIGIPGLLQLPEYSYARGEYTAQQRHDPHYDIDRAVAARQARQTMFAAAGTTYELILTEGALRRTSAPPEVLQKQRDHLASISETNPSIKVRVLLDPAPLPYLALPRTSFSLYDYPDPKDGTLAVADTETEDRLYHQPHDLDRYLHLYQAISDAALSTTETVEYIQTLMHGTPPPEPTETR